MDGKQAQEGVVVPSLLELTCNLAESVRLREELVARIHETDVLTLIYKRQLQAAGKDGERSGELDSLSLDTQLISK